MICRHCGAKIPDDQLVCPECGAEVQIVPDYNPLDDVLAREVKGSVEGATRQIRTDDIRRFRSGSRTQNVRSTRVLGQTEMHRIRQEYRDRGVREGGARYGGDPEPGRRGTGDLSRSRESGEVRRQGTGSVRGQNTGAVRRQGTGSVRDPRQDTAELRRLRQQRRLEAAKRKRRNLLIALFLILAFIAAGVVIAYQNSYTGMIRKGYRAIQSRNYDAAEGYFERAVIKDKSRPDAYVGMAEIYIDQDDTESAEEVFLSAIESQPTNAQLYQAAISFYMDTEQPEKIASLLQGCEDEGVLGSVSDYLSGEPEFSLEEGTYEEVQEVALTSPDGGEIYYTTDGTEPSAASGTKYEEPILLQTEGTTEIRAVSVNEKGIPSVAVSKKYTIEFPIVDAPAVTPSTGQYSGDEEITITVPEGYTAYYTTDGSVPSPGEGSTQKYSGPVKMPENTTTTFQAVLVNNENGKATEVTTRSYIR